MKLWDKMTGVLSAFFAQSSSDHHANAQPLTHAKYIPGREVERLIDGEKQLTLMTVSPTRSICSEAVVETYNGVAQDDKGHMYMLNCHTKMGDGLDHWSDWPSGTVLTGIVTKGSYVTEVTAIGFAPDVDFAVDATEPVITIRPGERVKYLEDNNPIDFAMDGERRLTLRSVQPFDYLSGDEIIPGYQGWARDEKGVDYMLDLNTVVGSNLNHWSDWPLGTVFYADVTTARYIPAASIILHYGPESGPEMPAPSV